MRVVLQRVARASVKVEGRVTGAIGPGFLALVGLTHTDGEAQIQWMAKKIVSLRLFRDEDGRMNRSLEDVGGRILAVSQFTLYGDAVKGRRPSFVSAAPPEKAAPLFDLFVEALRREGVAVATGVFGATMDVELVNDGPVTLILER
ncbi:MAG TPA: D-tyrosyl-tRNA(Tyr) deacylase [Planctomycetes bacterium]|nr:D-tyrosyl-tRNA(Tyr) deacylase [Planctomycetota bacterium]